VIGADTDTVAASRPCATDIGWSVLRARHNMGREAGLAETDGGAPVSPWLHSRSAGPMPSSPAAVCERAVAVIAARNQSSNAFYVLRCREVWVSGGAG